MSYLIDIINTDNELNLIDDILSHNSKEMTLQSKEFYEIMNVFEKNAKQFVNLGSMGLTKEPKENWIKQLYYCDGNANNAFKMFMHGVSLGKIL